MPNEMTAEEAAEILENMAEKDFQSDGTHFEADENIAINYAASILRRVAAGELKPVIHAHWIEVDDDCSNIWERSHCGLVWEMSNDSTPKENEMLHCPKSGALMDELNDSHE